MSVTRVRITSRSCFSADSSVVTASADASRVRIASSSRDSRWFSSAARACSDFIRSTIPTSSFTFSSRRSIGSSSTLRVAVLAITNHQLSNSPLSLNRPVLADERGQNRLDALVDLGVRQRALGGLKRQAHGQADRALRHPFALVPIEKSGCDERRRQTASGGENGATNDLRRQGLRDDDRQVADDERVPRERHGGVGRNRARAIEQIEIEFGDADAILTRQSA